MDDVLSGLGRLQKISKFRIIILTVRLFSMRKYCFTYGVI